jgi:hypothetical protein
MSDSLEVVFREFVHPNLSEADRIPPEDVNATAPFVWRPLTEYVAHVGTRNYLQRTPTHPRLMYKALVIVNISET